LKRINDDDDEYDNQMEQEYNQEMDEEYNHTKPVKKKKVNYENK